MSSPTSSSADTEAKTLTVWDYKPWWCQPWSILLTGWGAIAGSWLFLHRYWVTALVAVPLLAWMGFFLIIFPKAAAESGLLDEMRRSHSNPPAES